MVKREDLTGREFGRWKVLAFSHIRKSKYAYWKCQCSCGTEKFVRGCKLRGGESKSCGCLHKELASLRLTTHGMTNTSIYRIWTNMKVRCYDPNNKGFKDYGGRGITICPEWLNSFEIFYKDVGNRPDGMSLDRIDNAGNYEPSNVQWATKEDQENNKRSNVYYEYDGKRLTVPQWGRLKGVKISNLYERINKLGWTFEEAITRPAWWRKDSKTYSYEERSLTLTQWSREKNISQAALYMRVNKLGWSFEKSITTPIPVKKV